MKTPFNFKIFSVNNSQGFDGFITLQELMDKNCEQIPDVAGIYMVVRPTMDEHRFCDYEFHGEVMNAVKTYRGKPLEKSFEELTEAWVEDTPVIYIGKASTTLRKRLIPYMKFGKGIPAPHRGGRCIWQLEDARQCLMVWREMPDGDTKKAESDMIDQFVKQFKKLPFANWRR